jgi:hypothetical protein
MGASFSTYFDFWPFDVLFQTRGYQLRQHLHKVFHVDRRMQPGPRKLTPLIPPNIVQANRNREERKSVETNTDENGFGPITWGA